MTTAKINRAIKKYNLEIVHQRGSGYSYFLDLITGNQVGDSVPVCYLNQQTLDKWVNDAQWARIHDVAKYVQRKWDLENRRDIHPICKI